MSQFVLPEAAGDSLRNTLADMDAALRYLPGETGIGRDHIERWRDSLREAVGQRVAAPARRRGRKAKCASAGEV